LDERGIINYIRDAFGKNMSFELNDDVAYVKEGDEFMVLKVDMLVGSTDVPPGMSPQQIGRKALVAAVSDFAAKGVMPRGSLLSIGLPRGYQEEHIKGIINGFRDASREFGVELLGGDVNESKDLAIDCVLYGRTKRRVGRGGSKPGDLILVTGEFGPGKAGLDFLLKGQGLPDGKMKDRCVLAALEQRPPLLFGVRAIEAGLLTSSMDSSDGLAATLNEMSRQSGMKYIIEKLPIDPAMADFLRSSNNDVYSDVFFGGEEYQVVFTCDRGSLTELRALARSFGVTLTPIGRVDEGRGVFFCEAGGGCVPIQDRGWVHFDSTV